MANSYVKHNFYTRSQYLHCRRVFTLCTWTWIPEITIDIRCMADKVRPNICIAHILNTDNLQYEIMIQSRTIQVLVQTVNTDAVKILPWFRVETRIFSIWSPELISAKSSYAGRIGFAWLWMLKYKRIWVFFGEVPLFIYAHGDVALKRTFVTLYLASFWSYDANIRYIQLLSTYKCSDVG